MRLLLILLSSCVFLFGCASEENQDIKEWMQEQAKDMRGRVPRLPEIKPFPPVAYEAETLLSPFVAGKIVTIDATVDKTAPDRNRPLQPLESFPLEDLKVVGVILSGSKPYALIQTPPPNKPKNVVVGEYIGQSFGKIVAIKKDGVTVRETVRDINGVWIEQEKTLSVPKEGGSQ
ncbi:MAG: pilus assembly protein PilP [Rugosibacter sp.]|nr:MAG: pilus assembly protein PilP [Rugosibacter sp.]